MKKAKVILTAIVVLAVAGSALAFKAKKGENIFCTMIPGQIAGTEFCPLLPNHTLDGAGDKQAYCTAVINTECVFTTYKTKD